LAESFVPARLRIREMSPAVRSPERSSWCLEQMRLRGSSGSCPAAPPLESLFAPLVTSNE
jgi:hypothetical protein